MVSKRKIPVCLCNGVYKTEILKVLKKGARELSEIQKLTLAGTGCGRCKIETEGIIQEYFNSHKPDLQRLIEF